MQVSTFRLESDHAWKPQAKLHFLFNSSFRHFGSLLFLEIIWIWKKGFYLQLESLWVNYFICYFLYNSSYHSTLLTHGQLKASQEVVLQYSHTELWQSVFAKPVCIIWFTAFRACSNTNGISSLHNILAQ